MSRRRAYTKTAVPVSKSREEITNTLTRWGVAGISWSDDFDEGVVILRFRWTNDDDHTFVARFMIDLEPDEKIREEAVDGRNGKFSENKYEKLLLERGKREHRLLAAYLKNAFEAVEEGLIRPEMVFLSWIEDSSGITVAERIGPIMDQLTKSTLPKMLAEAK